MSWKSPEERTRAGLEARERVPVEAHAELDVAGRRSPVDVLGAQNTSRVQELVPLRHERMLTSSFAFYRGGAAVMAGDLVRTRSSGLDVQLCGDAHLANFGMFGSPERRLVFDINDFDETSPGPWEWDVKRLVSSLVIAGQANGFPDKQTRRVTAAAVTRYRDAMKEFAAMGNLSLWYARVDIDQAKLLFGGELDDTMVARIDKTVTKAQKRNHHRALKKLTEVVDGQRRIIADPPTVVPVSHFAEGVAREDIAVWVRSILDQYSQSLDPGHRRLVSSYSFVDMARKAVGVGSVGTRCWIVLLQGRDDGDPLFLQVKEAQRSVVAAQLGADPEDNEGRRVVVGQRLMQASGDVFLGWKRTTGVDGIERDFYVRQLHDWKGSVEIETLTPKGLRLYGELCAWTLARAHARSGDRIAIAAYLGDDDGPVDAFTEFAHAYAALNEEDYATFADAVRSGELAGTPAG